MTNIIIRQFKTGYKDWIVFFPDVPSDYVGYNCESYMKIGQHGGADYMGLLPLTKPVKDQNIINEVLDELKSIGYDNIRIYQKETKVLRQARIDEANSYK